MKPSHKVLALLAASFVAAAVLNFSFADPRAAGTPSEAFTPATGAGTRVGVCNVVDVFNNSDQAKVSREDLQRRRDQINAESERRAEALQQIQMELEALREGSAEHKKRLEEMLSLGFEKEGWEKAQAAILMKSYQQSTLDMYQQILTVVAEIAKERGLELVLFQVQEPVTAETPEELIAQISRRQVLYSDESLDLTEIVLARLNQAYHAENR